MNIGRMSVKCNTTNAKYWSRYVSREGSQRMSNLQEPSSRTGNDGLRHNSLLISPPLNFPSNALSRSNSVNSLSQWPTFNCWNASLVPHVGPFHRGPHRFTPYGQATCATLLSTSRCRSGSHKFQATSVEPSWPFSWPVGLPQCHP